jgi:hypothetical protein
MCSRISATESPATGVGATQIDDSEGNPKAAANSTSDEFSGASNLESHAFDNLERALSSRAAGKFDGVRDHARADANVDDDSSAANRLDHMNGLSSTALAKTTGLAQLILLGLTYAPPGSLLARQITASMLSPASWPR